MIDRRVRVRFAPSPTGPLHLGGVRTALFNYLFARQRGGDFLLRIEDTDSTRYVPGAEEYIFDSLAWCGLRADEGVREGGPYGPYRQSERKAIYRQYAEQLVATGWAYYAFDSPEKLATKRAEYEARKEVFAYGPLTRDSMDNALGMSFPEVLARVEQSDDWVIRFKMPKGRRVVMEDLIRGHVEVDTDTLDDKVLYKHADGLPTYHLANVVDDRLMQISHVIRGEEWLPSLPLHYLLYEALGWKEGMPEFAHLPLILKPTGNGKLSKRDGDKLGFPVFPLEWHSPDGEVYRGYREDGYIPEAFLNMLAMLGWNSGCQEEIFTLGELEARFSFDRVSKSGARFDPEKAKWFNKEHLQMVDIKVLTEYLSGQLESHGVQASRERVEAAVKLVRDRITLLPDLWTETDYLWEAPQAYEEKGVKKHCNEQTPAILEAVMGVLQDVKELKAESVHEAVSGLVEGQGWPLGKVMNSLRLAQVGASRGINVADIVVFLGQEETLRRLGNFRDYLQASRAD